ncbi:polyketide synthase dehydratase domain-containing protein, partial [Streptomyces boncukensis]
HTVAGTAVVPGAALVEWALRAADEAGCGAVAELGLRAPLTLPESGAVLVQVGVEAPDAEGLCDVRVSSRPDDGQHWTCHATGTLGPPPPAEEGQGQEDQDRAEALDGAWPPAGAEPVDLDGFYERAAAAEYGYGPAFRGLRAVWRHGEELLAEAVLPGAAGGHDGFAVHPALLDAALQPALLEGPGADDGRTWLPFAWSGVTLWADEATAVRVRLTPLESGAGERELKVVVADAAGAPVLTAESVVLLPADAEQLRAAARSAGHGRPDPAQAPRAGRPGRRRTAAGVGPSVDWSSRLAALPADERSRALLGLVREHAAAVLGHTDPAAVPVDAAFKDLGFTSLTAVELRDRLAGATGLRLPVAFVFRHPTPEGIAGELLRRLAPEDGGSERPDALTPLLGELSRLDAALGAAVLEDGDLGAVTARLEDLLTKWKEARRPPSEAATSVDTLQTASPEQVLAFIDNELGVS